MPHRTPTLRLPVVPSRSVVVPRRGDRGVGRGVAVVTAKLPAVQPAPAPAASAAAPASAAAEIAGDSVQGSLRLGVAGRLALVRVPGFARVGVLRVAVVSGLSVPGVVRLWWQVAVGFEFREAAVSSHGPGVAGLCLWVLEQAGFRHGVGHVVCPECGRGVSVNASGRLDAHTGVSGAGCGGSYDWAFSGLFARLCERRLVRPVPWWVRVRKTLAVARLLVGSGR